MFVIQNKEIWCVLPCNARKVSIDEARKIVDSLLQLIPLAEEVSRTKFLPAACEVLENENGN